MSTAAVAVEAIASRILVLRGLRVLVDSDLAALYGVPTKRFNEAVKRNAARFPAEFMFQLPDEESASLRSQIATSNGGRGGRRYLPQVFTEHACSGPAEVCCYRPLGTSATGARPAALSRPFSQARAASSAAWA